MKHIRNKDMYNKKKVVLDLKSKISVSLPLPPNELIKMSWNIIH